MLSAPGPRVGAGPHVGVGATSDRRRDHCSFLERLCHDSKSVSFCHF